MCMYIYLYVSGGSVRLFRPGPKPIDFFSVFVTVVKRKMREYTQMKIAGHPAQHAHTHTHICKHRRENTQKRVRIYKVPGLPVHIIISYSI